MFYISKLLKFLVSFGARTEMSITIVANVSHIVFFVILIFTQEILYVLINILYSKGNNSKCVFFSQDEKTVIPLR